MKSNCSIVDKLISRAFFALFVFIFMLTPAGVANAYQVSSYKPRDQLPDSHNQNDVVAYTYTLTNDQMHTVPLYVYNRDGSPLKIIGEFVPDFSGQTASFGSFGDGRDGDVVVTSGQTLVINQTRVNVSASGAGAAPANSTGFAVGDLVLFYQAQNTTNVGLWELAQIAAINSSTSWTLVEPLSYAYDNTNGRAQVIKVPQYSNVTVQSGGTLTAPAWDGSTGGILVFRANGTVTISGTASVNGSNGNNSTGYGSVAGAIGGGFRGGAGVAYSNYSAGGHGYAGEGTSGPSARQFTANGNGGGGGLNNKSGFSSGAGGGNGQSGTNGTGAGGDYDGFQHAYGGSATGLPDLTRMVFGGGGGGVSLYSTISQGYGSGASGGGVVFISGLTVTITGTVSTKGGNASSGGGGAGSGGSILLRVGTVNFGTNNLLTAVGGTPASWAGQGGAGRIRIEYGTMTGTATINPAPSLQQVVFNPAVTINQTNGQSDPTSVFPINFTATFSKPIDLSTFTSSDITLFGTAGATTANISQITPNDGTTFNIAVSGMTGSGTVIVSLDATKITDLAGNPNLASTSTDNTVTYTVATISGNAGVAGATLSYTDGIAKTTTADNSGNYSITVPHNWSGTVTPSKSGYFFSPASRDYANVTADQSAQDYTLATLCSTVTQIPQLECEALVALYNNTNGANWTHTTNWLAINTPCNWYGVGCSAGHVTSLFLGRNQLTGNIPPEIGNLTSLQGLYLSSNRLAGIPSEIGNLISLSDLNLSANQLKNIPAEIGNLTSLQGLYFCYNQLTSVPAEIWNLTSLQYLSFCNNQLTGNIPPEIGNLTSLQGLYLSSNYLAGIPSEIGYLISLSDLDLSDNQLTVIPPEIGSLTLLQSLNFSNNQLTGNIPPEIGNLTGLSSLDFSNNQLTGSIPPELGNLTNLQYLSVQSNQLTGKIPETIINLVNLINLSLDCSLTSSKPAVIAFVSAKSPDWPNCPITLTIEQADTQPDPTSLFPINFKAVFSAPINIATFMLGDVTLGGTAGPTTLVIAEIAPNDGTTFNIAVSGMTNYGTVTASIGADKVTNAAGNLNTASISADNTVIYDEADTACQDVPSIALDQDRVSMLHVPTDIDVYKFEVTEPFTTIVAALTPPATGDFDLYLYQGCASVLDWGGGRRYLNIGIGGNTDPTGSAPDPDIELYRNVRNEIQHGTTYYLVVRKPEGGAYSAESYRLNVRLTPPNVGMNNSADSDGDGLLDVWEINGLWVGDVFVNLPAMGANPLRKDIFVEIDYMADALHSHQPKPDAIAKVVQAFANAPVSNPDGSVGITLHVDYGPDSEMNPVTHAKWGARSQSNSLPHVDDLGHAWKDAYKHYSWKDFDALKQTNFSKAREMVFHYGIFAHDLGNLEDTSGVSRDSGTSDFIVSLGSWDNGVGSVNQQAGTFMHELGHNLGLLHGGNDNRQYKPNLLSVMNYFFQTRGLLFNGMDGFFDYSRFEQLPILDEGSLNELVGLNGGSAINDYGTRYFCLNDNRISNNANGVTDWNCDGNIAGSVQTDINGDVHIDTLASYNEWLNLDYAGGSIGAFGITHPVLSQTVVEEITYTEDARILSPYKVTLAASGNLEASTGSVIVHTFTVRNLGINADTYTISATSLLGWANLNGVPATINLAAGASAEISIPVNVPLSVGLGEQEKIILSAVSQANPNMGDQAISLTTGLDTTAPSVGAVVRVNSSPTNLASAKIQVTFTEPVSGVDASDFIFTKTGNITGYAITNVSPASGPASAYTVTVNTGAGNGTIRLDVVDNDTIVDRAGNSLNGEYTGGEAYTITKEFTISGNAGTAGATLGYTDGILKTVTADANGDYLFPVPYGWSGAVTPSKTGYTFAPASKSYDNVVANQTAQNYVATQDNQAPTDITLSNSSVAENQAIGVVVGILDSTDPDAGDTFTYSFCGGADDASFGIVSDTLMTGGIFNYETKSVYSVCIRTSDGQHTFDKTFSIDVTNLADYEIILNGGFEAYKGTSLIPNSWTAVKFSGTDGKDITIRKSGKASVKITGKSNTTKTLAQILSIAGFYNDPFIFSYYAKGASVPAAKKCVGEVIFYNHGTQAGSSIALNCPKGSNGKFGFTKVSHSFNAPGDYDKVIVKFTYSKGGGTIWFDLASLLK